AFGGGLDAVQRQRVHVDEVRGRLDLQLHQVQQVGAAGDELRGRMARHRSGGFGGRVGAFVGEGLHVRTPATSEIASTMLEYAPQRQMLPLMRSRSSSADSSGRTLRSAVA